MSTVDQLLREGTRRLAGRGDSPRLDAELLLAHALGQSREMLYRSLWADVPPDAQAIYAALLAQRESLTVSNDTLIPRPETELLVDRVLARVPVDATWRIADLGTGTGAIALAIASERPQCKVVATDISKAALAVARRNATALGLTNVSFREGNWFGALTAPKTARSRFHLLISNPPYIAAHEWAESDPELQFEPRIALDGGEDGLDAYRVLTSMAPAYLQPGGWLVLEHGFRQGDEVRVLLKAAGFGNVATASDLAGRPRVSEGQYGAPP
ncbi:MAG: peptide chain release factor N(5)-glutamine methyltransferase [Gammaproteobacteria bacterium PRO9]|nr:peptide chain release factor N(5)-glutamine methyltransferase [Gammaproteobacteria bacterium PRO9]